MLVPAVKDQLAASDRALTDAIVVGLEAHVCVQQSTLDLLALGLNVHLCVDAVSSQSTTDRACGLHRCHAAGAFLTTTESVLFELIRGKDHPQFKAISATVKECRAEDPLGFL
jgi:nicotinamidase-related amidase